MAIVHMYRVFHHDRPLADLAAVSEENAIQNACKIRGLSWGTEAADCRAIRVQRAQKDYCVGCGRHVEVNGQKLCTPCQLDRRRRRMGLEP